MNKQTYEAPEVFELGEADKLTLGWTSKHCPDGCDCTKNGVCRPPT